MKIFKNKSNAGFSMLEVLVASTILVIIVMMLSMLFQQTGIAWRTGVRRAGIFMQARSLIGALQRDAVKAVDENSIDDRLTALLGGGQDFKADRLSFYTLSGSGFEGDDIVNGVPRRSLSFITYNAEGKRTEIPLLANGKPGTPVSSVVTVSISGNKNAPQTSPPIFDYTYAPYNSEFPISMRLKADVTSEGYNLEIGAGSAGPDGAWGTKDDIRTWIEKN